VPSYFYDDGYWGQLAQGHPTVGIGVVNPNSGPGNSLDDHFLTEVQNSQAAGLTVLGYVATGYGSKSTSTVESQIDAYYKWYHVDGIFFDETSTDCGFASHYTTLHDYVKTKGGKASVVLNFGIHTNECYMPAADILITYEGPYSDYMSGDYQQPSWVNKYPANRFWHLVYDTPTAQDMQRAVSTSKARGAGWVYVTPETVDQGPWNMLPSSSYWNSELSATQG
jgi:hypothetical protein